ncbi:MAG: hypothetical protein HY662_03590, partial [Chloroflexi bacterium]|nr:hypothetical protein [Chloroflexota bacterium]
TGPIKKHLTALEKAAPEIVSTYRELGRQTIPVALGKGRIDKQQAEALNALLEVPGLVTSQGKR